MFEVLTVVFLRIKVLWGSYAVLTDSSKDHNAFTLRAKQSKTFTQKIKGLLSFGTLGNTQ